MSDEDAWKPTADEVRFSLSWTHQSGGELAGTLHATNLSSRVIRLYGKPGLTPIGLDGVPLDADTVITLELVLPGYAELVPGGHASCRVSWAGWDGPPASGQVKIAWPGGEAVLEADGPVQPTSRGPAHNLSSGWFTTLQ